MPIGIHYSAALLTAASLTYIVSALADLEMAAWRLALLAGVVATLAVVALWGVARVGFGADLWGDAATARAAAATGVPCGRFVGTFIVVFCIALAFQSTSIRIGEYGAAVGWATFYAMAAVMGLWGHANEHRR